MLSKYIHSNTTTHPCCRFVMRGNLGKKRKWMGTKTKKANDSWLISLKVIPLLCWDFEKDSLQRISLTFPPKMYIKESIAYCTFYGMMEFKLPSKVKIYGISSSSYKFFSLSLSCAYSLFFVHDNIMMIFNGCGGGRTDVLSAHNDNYGLTVVV